MQSQYWRVKFTCTKIADQVGYYFEWLILVQTVFGTSHVKKKKKWKEKNKSYDMTTCK